MKDMQNSGLAEGQMERNKVRYGNMEDNKLCDVDMQKWNMRTIHPTADILQILSLHKI